MQDNLLLVISNRMISNFYTDMLAAMLLGYPNSLLTIRTELSLDFPQLMVTNNLSIQLELPGQLCTIKLAFSADILLVSMGDCSTQCSKP